MTMKQHELDNHQIYCLMSSIRDNVNYSHTTTHVDMVWALTRAWRRDTTAVTANEIDALRSYIDGSIPFGVRQSGVIKCHIRDDGVYLKGRLMIPLVKKIPLPVSLLPYQLKEYFKGNITAKDIFNLVEGRPWGCENGASIIDVDQWSVRITGRTAQEGNKFGNISFNNGELKLEDIGFHSPGGKYARTRTINTFV